VLEQERDIVVCGEAVDVRDAIDKAMDLHPDLIILDMAMPNMNGLQAADILHQIMPAVPMILFSMHADSVLRSQVQAAGIAAVVAKGQAADLLLVQAKELLGLPGFSNRPQ
jgi:DNA-binding NarL/FixJ family response regulator